MAVISSTFKDSLGGLHYDTEHQTHLARLFGNTPDQTGKATLVGGTVVVPSTYVTATSLVFISAMSAVTAAQSLYVSAIVPGVSFTITDVAGTSTATVAFAVV